MFGLEADWHPLDPLRAAAVNDADIDGAIYGTLLDVTPNGKIEPGLATGYSVSPDGLTYDLELRHGVMFQDGTKFDAAAVKFNLDRELDPKNDCLCRIFISAISSVDTKGPYHVILHLSRPFAPLPYHWREFMAGWLRPRPQSRITARITPTIRSVRGRSASSASSPATMSRWSVGRGNGTRATRISTR